MTLQLDEILLDEPHILLTTTGQDGIATGKISGDVAHKLQAGESIGNLIQVVPVAHYAIENPGAVREYLDSN